MKAGFCTTDITPAIGMEKPGGYGKAYCLAIHDPLQARAAVFEDGDTRVALVGLDTLVIAERTVAAIRAEIEKRCGIPASNILIAASHTHVGGPLFGHFPDQYEDAPKLIQSLIADHSTIPDLLYHDWVIKQAASAIIEADRKKQDAVLCVDSGHQENVAFNRRLRMQHGKAVSHPGKGNPGIIDYAGPIDPEVGVVGAWSQQGEFLGCVVNYTCHCTTFGGAVSADWVYHLDRTVRNVMGQQGVVVFLNGACGDVTQVDNKSVALPQFPDSSARLVGVSVGAEALKVLNRAARGEFSTVASVSRKMTFGRRTPSSARVAKAREIVEAGIHDEERRATTEWTFAKEVLILDYLAGQTPEVEGEIQAIQLGPVVYLANPAEYFCGLGLKIKEGSQFPFTYVVELANGIIGYVPDEEAFSATGGGYETVLTSYSNLEVTAGTQIADACVELSRQLQPTAAPEPPKMEPATAMWGYGQLGPELE
ncbi:MAG: hypothetical protein COZ56_06095 [Armatimonadetes bacterium CG_4_8_14_3_um_filter_58_9]|nr:MAG: hypothetical protein COZ56_06095 [Armatimonadetes bacterium CG_4_8_14_3_um_filter_58_9]